MAAQGNIVMWLGTSRLTDIKLGFLMATEYVAVERNKV
jgi:hypothetical protein